MFQIKIGTPSGSYSTGDPIGDITYSNKYIEVKDHSYLIDHLLAKGIKLEEVNFFTWRALPERSYGKFLVSEKEWLELIGAPTTEVGQDPKPRLASLKILDQDNQLEFTNLEIVSTSFVMSPIYPVGAQFQDGSRILLIELEHNGYNQDYRQTNRRYQSYSSFSDILGEFSNGTLLVPPYIYNKHEIPNVSIVDYLAFIASSNFLTSFLPPGNSIPKLTNSKFVFPNNAQLLYDKVSTLDRPLSLVSVLKSDSLCQDQYKQSDPIPITISDNLYRSPVNANTETVEIKVVAPYELYDHIRDSYDLTHGVSIANSTALALKSNANTRLARNIDVIYQGLVLGEISNDVQRITYYYQGNNYGLRTRLESVPWKVHECILSIRDKCKDTVFKGVLLSNYVAGTGASAVVFDMGIANKIIEYTTVVKDPIGVFSTLKKGASVLLYKSCGSGMFEYSCDYYIIQSECPTTTQPSNIVGKCVVGEYCYNTIEDVCDKLNGTWTSGAICSSTPYGS